MMLDTGATFVSIPTSVALELGYDIDHPESTLPITTASGIVRAPIITLDSIEVLGVKATNIKGDVHRYARKYDLRRSAWAFVPAKL